MARDDEKTILLTNALIITMDDERRILRGGIRLRRDKIAEVGDPSPSKGERILNLRGAAVLPGFIQAHLHLCQTLLRHAGEDLELLDWLRRRIWPLEAAHTPDSLYASARLGIAELLKNGTTALLDMGTVHHTDAIFEAAKSSGIRATIGKAMMDEGEGIPPGLREGTDDSLQSSCDLFERWNGAENGRLSYAFCPRFVPSCSRRLLELLVAEVDKRVARIHTHASENRAEIELVRRMTGMDNIDYFHSLGLTGDHVGLAHCVWVSEHEMQVLSETGTHVLHCPGSNFKLASGLAPIPSMLEHGVALAIGSDGAPCNNRLSILDEMRLAGLIQRPKHGPASMKAEDIVAMATRGGAAALGLSTGGQIRPGFLADLVVLDLDDLGNLGASDVYTKIVYASDARHIRHVFVGGRELVRDGTLLSMNEREIVNDARHEGRALFKRAGLEELWFK